jgi:hypothetical protein
MWLLSSRCRNVNRVKKHRRLGEEDVIRIYLHHLSQRTLLMLLASNQASLPRNYSQSLPDYKFELARVEMALSENCLGLSLAKAYPVTPSECSPQERYPNRSQAAKRGFECQGSRQYHGGGSCQTCRADLRGLCRSQIGV